MPRERKTQPLPIHEATAPVALIEKQIGPETCGKCQSKDVQTYATANRSKIVTRYHRCRKCGYVFQTNRQHLGLIQTRPLEQFATR